jgi:hypothetical protein
VEAKPPAPPQDPWEVKYKVLAGKYSAEVPRLSEENKDLKARLSELEAKISQLSAPPDPLSSSKLTPEEVVERFGEDFASAVGAVAARIADSRADTLRKELTPKMDQVEQRMAKSARELFMGDLTKLVPNWKQIDIDDGFTAFLDEVDPMTGYPRRKFFNEADQSNDAARVARFFTTYTGGTTAPAGKTRQSSSIEQQLSPDTSRVSAPTPPGKKVWRRGEIAAFYADARRGRFKPDEYQRIESDIFAAQRENRIAA